MKTAVYDMRRDGWNDYFQLFVSPNAKAMRRLIASKFAKWGCPLPTDGWTETRGMFKPISSDDGSFGCMFLAEDGLGVSIVSHECLHAAMAHERFILRFGMNYGPQIGNDEERLCYFFDNCLSGVYATLRENGHVKAYEKGIKR
jgi:hypothetical protein